MQKFGIDISKWQGNFNFDAAMRDGVEFVIVKGGGGDSGLYVDRKFERNYKEAKKRGLPVGVYWFSKALTISDAKKEAAYFYEHCLKGKQYELPVYIDVEHKAQLSLGRKELTDIVLAWMEDIQSRGYWVGVYSMPWCFQSEMEDERLQGYAHWCAQWVTKCTYQGKPGVFGMWQFGGETNLLRSTMIAGQVVDQNYMYIDYPKQIKAAGLNGFKKSAAVPKQKTTDELAREVIAGKWGVGADRKKRLTAAGYDYSVVQRVVNLLMKK